MKRAIPSICLALVAASALARENVIRDVKIDRGSIFAGLDRVTLSARLLRDGQVTVAVIDRDGYRVRTLASDTPAKSGAATWQWDGRDDAGSPVPDEAYSWRIDWRNGSARETYFPANQPPPKMQSIAVNRKRTYFDLAKSRTGKSEFTFHVSSHEHHMGLTAMDDTSPALTIEPVGLQWSAADRTWHAGSGPIVLRVTPSGPTAEHFTHQPAKLFRFVNGKEVASGKISGASQTIEIPADRLRGGANTITINWQSEYGAVAASSIRVTMPERVARGTSGEGRRP